MNAVWQYVPAADETVDPEYQLLVGGRDSGDRNPVH